MLTQVVDAVVIVDGAVLLDDVLRAQAVFDHEQRLLIAVVQVVEGNAEAQRIDGPAPLAFLEVRVLRARKRVALGPCGVGVRARRAARGVVAEGDEVDRVVGEDLLVLLGHPDVDAQALELLDGIGRVVAAALDIDKEVVVLVVELRRTNVLGAAAVRVVAAGGQHAADLDLRVDLVRDLGCPCARDQLVVSSEILDGFLVLALLKDQAGAHKRQVQNHVDLVEGEPVLH